LLPIARNIDPNAAILSPKGNVDERGAARFFRRFADGSFDLPDLRARTLALADWLREAARHYAIDLSRATLVGYSNGANTASALMLLQPGLVRSAVLLRGTHPLDVTPLPDLAGTRTLVLSGERDEIIPRDGVAKLATTLRTARASVQHEALPAGHELTRTDIELARAWLAQQEPRPNSHQ
jgi:phospholipase/carboxylesterase